MESLAICFTAYCYTQHANVAALLGGSFATRGPLVFGSVVFKRQRNHDAHGIVFCCYPADSWYHLLPCFVHRKSIQAS